jgi:hypothetical protein
MMTIQQVTRAVFLPPFDLAEEKRMSGRTDRPLRTNFAGRRNQRRLQ